MITALCGGVGGSKLVLGLYRVLPPGDLTVVVNTADDLDLWGLHISPDLDTVTYTLAGLAGREHGWGLQHDTFEALDMVQRYGLEAWFKVGDRDLGTHLFRTDALSRGETLTGVTARVASGLGVRASILPMTDGRVATHLLVEGEWLDFQEYFVHRRHAVPVQAVRYDREESTRPTNAVLAALSTPDVIVLVNSNPVLSILPILDLPGIREALARTSAAKVAVSPMLGSGSVTGPAGILMRLIGQPPTSTGVAATYRDVIDGIVIDREDERQVTEIEALGVRVRLSDTVMRTDADRERLAREVLDFAGVLR
jgi:LPPG:FO 2-phospho-L-lactate transferase